MDVALVLAGLVGLVVGGDLLIRGAVGVARRLNLSPLVIGLTLVGFGTSTPELVTSVQAALAGSPGLAVGNVVGSNIANVLLILGIACLIRPAAVSRAAFLRDGGALVLATLACLGLALSGSVGRLSGGLLVAALALFLAATLFVERRRPSPAGRVYERESEGLPPTAGRTGVALGLVAAGLALTLLGARLLVDGAIGVAGGLGVSEAVIGLTVLAVGTSLPELVASVAAARRGHSDLAFGNVLGSNIFNILGILGATALVRPLEVPAEIARFDVWAMALTTVALLAAALSNWRISRREGALLLAAYVGYLGWLGASA